MKEVPKKPKSWLTKAGEIVDRVVGVFAPESQVKRTQARRKMASYSSYQGANRSRNAFKSWYLTGNSPSQAVTDDREHLQEACNDLDRNSPIARGAATKLVESVIGEGLKHRSVIDDKVLGITREEAEEYERQIDNLWEYWAESYYSDVTLQGNFHDVVKTACFDEFVDGDVLFLRRFRNRTGKRKNAILSTAFQLIRSARISNKNYERNNELKVDGVNIDTDGAVQSYDIMKGDPGELRQVDRQNEWQTVRAYDSDGNAQARLVYDKRRAGQYRGIPALSASIENIKQQNDYRTGVAASAVLMSFFTAFLETEDGDDFSGDNESLVDSVSSIQDDEVAIGTGTIVPLRKGEKITPVESKKDAAEFSAFMEESLKLVAMDLNMPYEILRNHFQASYSASRGALLEWWRHVKVVRGKKACDLYQMAKEAIVNEAVQFGMIELPGFLDSPIVRAAYLKSEWLGAPVPQIDEVKAANAAGIRMKLGLSSGEKEAQRTNQSNYEDNLRQLSKEKKLADELGIPDYRTSELDDTEEIDVNNEGE